MINLTAEPLGRMPIVIIPVGDEGRSRLFASKVTLAPTEGRAEVDILNAFRVELDRPPGRSRHQQ